MFDAGTVLAYFLGTVLLVLLSIEGGYRIGRFVHRRSPREKESPVSSIEGSVLALLAFILALTFATTSDRFDTRRQLVREEANAIRTVWYRADFLPDAGRTETRKLLRQYLRARVDAFQSAEHERVVHVIDEAERTQARLWDIAVGHRSKIESDIGALYIQALNDVFTVHASRVAVGLQARIPIGIWLTLWLLTMLGMAMVGYHAGIAGSRRTVAMPVLAVSFAAVIALIASLDHPIGGFTLTRVSQQPLADLLSDIESGRIDFWLPADSK